MAVTIVVDNRDHGMAWLDALSVTLLYILYVVASVGTLWYSSILPVLLCLFIF